MSGEKISGYVVTRSENHFQTIKTCKEKSELKIITVQAQYWESTNYYLHYYMFPEKKKHPKKVQK